MTAVAHEPRSQTSPTAPISRVLILAHGGRLLDRRVVSQANALASSGRLVTLASSPFDHAAADLDPRITILTGPEPAGGLDQKLGLDRRLPAPAHALARRAWHRIRGGPARGVRDYFESLSIEAQFDVIHAHDLPALAAAGPLRDRFGSTLIYDAHELYPFQHEPGPQRAYWEAIERRVISTADRVVTVSPSFADQLAERYGIDRPAVIYNACEPVDRSQIDPRQQFAERFTLTACDTRTRVVFQGSQTLGRGLKRLITAVGMRSDRFVLGMIGEGPAHDALVSHAQEVAPDAVRFSPFVAQRELVPIIAGADLGVIPYGDGGLLNSRYCSPNKLFEYIEAGRPILANDLPEIRRVIDGYQLGLVAPMEDAESLAAGLDRIADLAESGAYTDDAFTRARDELGWEAQRDELLRIYESLGC